MLIDISQLSFAYGVHNIFENLDFRIDNHEHVGLIGNNGSGKTTFFKLLTGECLPDNGKIMKTNPLNIGLLKQEFHDDQHQTLHEFFLHAFDHLKKIENRIAALQQEIEQASSIEEQTKAVRQLTELQEKYADMGGYEYPSRIRGITVGLGFSSEDMNKTMAQFSGGEKTRIALGQLLLRSPDLLLLDEPTNYLDFETLTWLENYLNSYSNSFIVISHDRFFLDRVCTRICEIENKSFVTYNGNYSEYRIKKEKRDSAMKAAYDKQMRELKRQQDIVDKLRQYDTWQSSKAAASREKVIQKMQPITVLGKAKQIRFCFTPKIQSGNDVLITENLSKSFGDRQIFRNINFEVFRGDRIGIIGRNGIGKTTLFQILMKHQRADSGSVTFGKQVYPDYYAQEPDESMLAPGETLIEAIRDIDSHLNDSEIRRILAAFLFTGETVFKTIGELSGGEKARLNMARLMISEANFLLMDEPTNHIDMSTKEILENALLGYEGTLLFISHDRYFLNRIARKIFEFTPDGIIMTEGNYNDYAQRKFTEKTATESADFSQPQITKTQRKSERQKQKLIEAELRKKKKQLAEFENLMEANEETIAELEQTMCQPDFYNNIEKAQMINDQYNALKSENESLMEQWEFLALELEGNCN